MATQIEDDLFLEVSTGGLNNPEFLKVITETEEFASGQVEDELRSQKELAARLTKQVRDKNGEIDRLLRRIERLSDEKDEILHQSGDTIAEKLISITKKNRAMNLDIERERTKVRNLEREIREVRDEKVASVREIPAEPAPEAVEFQKMKQELMQSHQRAAESRNECLRLRQDLRISHKAILNEVGEDVNLEEVLAASTQQNASSWRGRSQKIAILQTKLQELRAQVSDKKPEPSRDQAKLAEIAQKRRKDMDVLKVENGALKKQVGDRDREITALRSRASHQSQEGKSLRNRIKVLTEKGTHDDELIETLSKRLQSLQKTMAQPRTMTVNATVSKGKIKNEDLVEMSKLKQLLGEKEAQISELKSEIFLQKNTIENLSNRPEVAQGSFELEKEELTAQINSLKMEHDSVRKMTREWSDRLNQDHPDAADARFAELFKSKQDDLNVYEATIEETRKVFMEAMKQMKEHVRKAAS